MSIKKTKTVKKIGLTSISLHNGNVINIFLEVVLKINLIHKNNQTD
jgi:hypothetical protein